MRQADRRLTTPPPKPTPIDNEPFAALAEALDPRWNEATQRLSHNLEAISYRLERVRECQNEGGNFVVRARKLLDTLIEILDAIDGDPDLEDDVREDVGDDEPSLGSFDRMTDQERSWRTQSLWAFPAVDAEQDDCDREDCDPDEEKLQPPEMGGAA